MEDINKRLLIFLIINFGYIGFVYTSIVHIIQLGLSILNTLVWLLGIMFWGIGTYFYFNNLIYKENDKK